MNLSERGRLVVAGALAGLLILGAFLFSHLGSGSPSTKPAASATPSASITAASQGGGAAVSSAGSTGAVSGNNPLSNGIDPSLKGEAADRAVLNAVIPTWGTFQLDWAQDRTQWLDTFNGSPNVADSFVTASKVAFYDLWAGAMQQGMNVGGCKIVSITPKSNSNGERVYTVRTSSTMSAASSDADVSGGSFTQTWTFTLSDNDSVPQITGYSAQ